MLRLDPDVFWWQACATGAHWAASELVRTFESRRSPLRAEAPPWFPAGVNGPLGSVVGTGRYDISSGDPGHSASDDLLDDFLEVTSRLAPRCFIPPHGRQRTAHVQRTSCVDLLQIWSDLERYQVQGTTQMYIN